MIKIRKIIVALALPLLWVSLVQGGDRQLSGCLNMTSNESRCKDCCDCLDTDGATRRSCRDNCAADDFSQNSEVIVVDAPSVLGRDGDYSVALNAKTEQECKEYCDGSDELACGDRHHCRDACNASFSDSSKHTPKPPENRGLPPEIITACQGRSIQAPCQVGESFTGRCHTSWNQLACLLDREAASTDVLTQWDKLDRNRDGFLDVNEIGDENKPGEHPRRGMKETIN